MDEPSAQAKVHVIDSYTHVIKEIDNLEQFHEAKVLAVGSKNVSATFSVHFGSKPTHPKQRSHGILINMAERQVTALKVWTGAGSQDEITDQILLWPIFLILRPKMI